MSPASVTLVGDFTCYFHQRVAHISSFAFEKYREKRNVRIVYRTPKQPSLVRACSFLTQNPDLDIGMTELLGASPSNLVTA